MISNKRRVFDPIGWLRDVVKRLGIGKALGRYYGLYRSQVIDVEDEESRGRIRLFIPAIGHVEDSDVPPNVWALPTTMTADGDGKSHGQYWTPDVGDNVWVMFEDGLTHLPIYFTGWIPRDASADGLASKDPKVKGFFTKSGHRVELNESNGGVLIQRGGSSTMISMSTDGFDDEILMTTKSGTNIFLNETNTTIFGEDGSHVTVGEDGVSLVNKSGAYVSIKGSDVNIGASGSIVISAGAKISLKGSVDIGNGPIYEPVVLGTKFQGAWSGHTHVCSPPGSPTVPGSTLPPVVPLAHLSGQVRVS
tara:strand:+ start:1901 stop:2818 length:918 start_codon:yes stop_codon:yes gene_type:complete